MMARLARLLSRRDDFDLGSVTGDRLPAVARTAEHGRCNEEENSLQHALADELKNTHANHLTVVRSMNS